MFCRFCGVEIPDESQFCSKCGKATQVHEAEQNYRLRGQMSQLKSEHNSAMQEETDKSQVTETESAKASGAAVGCMGGLAGSGCLLVLGGLLSATGIGAIIGVPMILAGLLLPFIGPILGFNSIKGPCPYCGYSVQALPTDPGLNCPACKQRIVVREKRFFKAK